MMVLKVELKSTNRILQDVVQSHVDCIIHRPVYSVGKLQGVQ